MLGLGAVGADEFAMKAVGLVPAAAYFAGVVGREERADDELARLDRGDVGADVFDDADVLMAHGGGPGDGVDAAVVPEIRPGYAGGGQADDGVGGMLQFRVVAVFEADVAGGVDDCTAHGLRSFVGWAVGGELGFC